MSDNNNAMSKLNELKKTIFYELLNVMGRVFVIVRYSEDVQIGTRGFVNAEKENGLVLVFNSKMNFTWSDDGLISARLVFGTKPEDCLIPIEHIIAVYSPELQTQFVTTYTTEVNNSSAPPAEAAPVPEKQEEPGEKEGDGLAAAESDNKILKVDFSKKKKKK
ncbi:MAG: hypothetical protein HQK96_01850 [Nitrospirae bacterium]|nr:hypothetical protein [Nitrospirota bacterium]